MSRELTFMMGKFQARFPADRRYTTNHQWAAEADGALRFGFTDYAVRLLRDVYFFEWIVDAPAEVAKGRPIGFIESQKAESDVYSPVAGRIVAWNDRLMDDPSIINKDGYGDGWLVTIDGSTDELLSVEAYLDHLAEAWKVAEKMIKCQWNE